MKAIWQVYYNIMLHHNASSHNAKIFKRCRQNKGHRLLKAMAQEAMQLMAVSLDMLT